jgi:hypothetical protein
MSRGPRLWPGKPYPRGATWDGAGTNGLPATDHAPPRSGSRVPVTTVCWPFPSPGRRYRAPDHAAQSIR